jgi:hypothetical protein
LMIEQTDHAPPLQNSKLSTGKPRPVFANIGS